MIRIKTWIRHDGRIYNAKDELEADEDTENRLVGLGVAELVDTHEKSDGSEDDSGGSGGKRSEDASGEDGSEEASPSREELEEEYKALGGQPRSDWTMEKLMSKLEERRGSRE